ncbi:MAG TPA: hypothetical protein VJI15_01750 [Candidatus Nanoarchaeia archaeon]|nr:hypothetical protein [Candidatus Nanoarchaeia archaeon]
MYKKRWNRARNSFSSPWSCRFSGIVGKQGQVTLFIIIGLVLLLVMILVISLRKELVSFATEEIIPTTKGKVESLITSCMLDIGDDVLFRLGLQAGYLDVPVQIADDPNLRLKVSPFQTVPYWAYGNQLFIPSLLQIKEDVDRYMEANLRDCVLALQPFQETYELIEKSGIESNVEFVDSGVIYNVHWNIEVQDKAGETITEVIDHVDQSPIKFKRVYESAREIVESELSDMKLEDITQDLISLDHPDLPVSGLDVSCATKTWDVQKARQALQDLLRINVKRLQVKGTDIIEYPDQFPYYQNHYVWNIGGEFTQPLVEVVFNYDNTYPFTFQVTPTQGGKMVSGGLGGIDVLKHICFQSWKFTYDVVYPVVVRVKDVTSGYTFQTAFSVHLIRNMPNRAAELKVIPSSTILGNYNEEYCQGADVLMSVLAWENVVDDQVFFDQQPLEGVNVSFTCVKYSCPMGATDFNFQQWGYQAGLTANFPYCVGGILRGTKEGYKEDWLRIIPKSGDQAELNLVPLHQFPLSGVKVVKHKFNGDGQSIGAAKDLANDETALIRMNVVLNGEEFHKVEQVIGKVIDEEGVKNTNISLLGKANFNYEVEVNIFDDDGLVGGYKGNWTIPWDDLQSGTTMTFHTLETSGTDEEEFAVFAALENYSKSVPLPEIR